MKQNTRIGIFGGSFNPPTQTHLMLAEYIIGRYVDKVLFLPVGDAYNKPSLISSAHRLAMLRLIIKDNPNFILSELETSNTEPSYTYDSLVTLHEIYNNATLFFLLGSDQLAGLSSWKRGEALLNTFSFILLVRAEDEPEQLFKADPWLERFRDRFHISNDHPRSNLSSSMIRARIARGQSVRYLTEESIIAYIKKHDLYHDFYGEGIPGRY